jgi:hypothetical protein
MPIAGPQKAVERDRRPAGGETAPCPVAAGAPSTGQETRGPELSAQQNLSALCKRLLALLSLAAAATLVLAVPGSASRTGLQNADSPDRAILAGLQNLIEEAQRRSPDGAAGGAPVKAWRPAAPPLVAVQPIARARAPVDAAGVPRPHAARAGPTRAPPRA